VRQHRPRIPALESPGLDPWPQPESPTITPPGPADGLPARFDLHTRFDLPARFGRLGLPARFDRFGLPARFDRFGLPARFGLVGSGQW